MNNTNHTAAQPLDLDKLEALARAATPGPWKRSNRPNGPFWHISSEYTIGGEPCKSGRQSIGAIHAENKRGAPKYAAMFEANANFVAEFNPATALALIAQARAAQPESATGTTGARVPTWQERQDQDNEQWNASVYMRQEIADLRAQLTQQGHGDETRQLLQEFVDYHSKPAGMTLEVALDSDSLGTFLEGVETREKDMVARAKAILAAPASAQPADACCKWPTCQSEEVQQQVADQAYRELYSGAQHDRGAAQGDDIAAALNAAVDAEYPLPDNPHASVIQRATDNRAAMWRGIVAARKILAAAPSPASKPVAPTDWQLVPKDPKTGTMLHMAWLSLGDGYQPSCTDMCRVYEAMLANAPVAAVVPSDARDAVLERAVQAAAVAAPSDDGEAFDAAIRAGELIWNHKLSARAIAFEGFKAGRATAVAAPVHWMPMLDQSPATSAADAKDAARLDFLDTNVHRFRMGWRLGSAPVGNLSIQSIIMGGSPIREAIDAAMAAAPSSEIGGAK